jgi:hypothetical protein
MIHPYKSQNNYHGLYGAIDVGEEPSKIMISLLKPEDLEKQQEM